MLNKNVFISALLTYGAWVVLWLRWPLESLPGVSNTNKRYLILTHEILLEVLSESTKTKNFQVAALFHIGTTKSHPPIPDHLSVAAKDFLLKCLQKYVTLNFLMLFLHCKFLVLVCFIVIDTCLKYMMEDGSTKQYW